MGRYAFAYSRRFHEADERDDGGAGEKADKEIPGKRRKGEGWEAARDGANDCAVPASMETKQPTEGSCKDEDNEDGGPAGAEVFEKNESEEREAAEEEGGEVSAMDLCTGDEHIAEVEAGTRLVDAEELAELGEGDNDSAGVREAHDGRVGDEVDDDGELENADREENEAGEAGEDDGEGSELLGGTGSEVEVGEYGIGEQGAHGNGASAELGAGAEEGGDDCGDKGSVEAKVRG